ncbi:MAG TPA: hypothetical protein PLM81_08385 [Ginsengibacter sp.]|nr:hypothetical protein [Ginsengibacter sp.]HRP44176.1 hypothetical protein [Ginsengibacter sp.]
MNSETKYCRSCYNHLAGYVGVSLTEALENKGILKRQNTGYDITESGLKFFNSLGISVQAPDKSNNRPLTRQCIDGSERRPHLAGKLGDALLHLLFEKKWVKRLGESRAIVPTDKGEREFFLPLGVPLRVTVD